MTKGVRDSTLQKKCKRWAKALRLGDWDIMCRYATKSETTQEYDSKDVICFDDSTIGRLHECSIPEKIALILIRRNYFDHDAYGVSWNIDTLIIHELIHIVEKVGKKNCNIPEKIKKRKDFKDLEEYNCDTFSAIMYFLYYDRI